ncbi:tetratricopeptide repeat protein 9C isoform X1 [Latimeria chalumnae]|uniref:Tetratricopeptide repeat protein 9C n=1 Tax=Latimeria chalumnae TaxID=7897 RepID=M3XLG7_LATCH|nr:PREDICTED: tetratricopeptide repeat protein 9C [Latimeria chalumnae]|eukprot:XP_005988871.1 PREDICTED: tetratricopeptide repeat protein 9C [Latimeria chalumnae]
MENKSCMGDVTSRIEQALHYKAEGNQCYREGHYQRAIGRYHRALMQLRGLETDAPSPLQAFGAEKVKLSKEQTELIEDTQATCYNNLAACLLQAEEVNYERVKDYSLKVLQKQPENVKALYRAGVAFHHLGDQERALHYLTKAARRLPNDANVKKYLQLTESKLNSYYQHEKEMYRGIFK